jgi:hypothetical protein
MNRLKALFFIFCLAALSCSGPAWPTPTGAPGQAQIITPNQAPTITQAARTIQSVAVTKLAARIDKTTATPTPAICLVRTGVEGGHLHLRVAPGIQSPARAWLLEDDELQPLPTPPVGIWLPVRAGNITGWVNSEMTSCEVKP